MSRGIGALQRAILRALNREIIRCENERKAGELSGFGVATLFTDEISEEITKIVIGPDGHVEEVPFGAPLRSVQRALANLWDRGYLVRDGGRGGHGTFVQSRWTTAAEYDRYQRTLTAKGTQGQLDRRTDDE